MNNRKYIRDLLTHYNVIFLQETWLNDASEVYRILGINPNDFRVIHKSPTLEQTETLKKRGRSPGGI